MSNYLRNRPFMIISYNYVLTPGQKSNVKGFNDTAQWDPIENMVISDRVSTKQMQMAELIIDLFENKVVKCRDASLDHQELINAFVSRHYEEVKGALAQWIKNDPSNFAKVQKFVENFKGNSTPPLEEIEDGLKTIVHAFMFEPNTQEIRSRVEEAMSKYLDMLGLQEYIVNCSDINNTEERINANELWADAAVQFKGADEFRHIAIRITKEVENA